MKLRLLIAGILGCLCFSAAFATVDFVQITDPHIFDSQDEAEGNKEALRWCINQINARVDAKADYKFIVVTGDLGLEGLASGGSEKEQNAIIDAAKQLAGIIKDSTIKQWLFLPGNNDLVKENPATIGIFQNFVKALQAQLQGMTIVNLCPIETEPLSGVLTEGTCRFIGFNNASFKSNDSAVDAAAFQASQLKNVEEVLARLAAPGFKYAYIFYHVPEIDDPYYASLDPNTPKDDEILKEREKKRGEIGKNFPHSAWTVTPAVRAKWNQIVTDERVKGLFAGHFHSSRREIYQRFEWIRSSAYLSGSLIKLSVCPPVASKRQENEPVQARGFREVSIDCESGKVKSRIFWYEKNRGPHPQFVERELVLSVDPTTNTASGLIHLSNPTDKEISISLSADDFKSGTTGYGLNTKVVFAAPLETTGQQVYERKLAAGMTIAMKVDVSNFLEAGEATAHLSNYGEPIGTLRATKWRPPFAVTILSATPDKPEFTFTKGKSCRITLKNADPMTYQIAVSMEVDAGASDAPPVTLSPNSSALLELKPRDEWFPWATQVRETVRDGNISLKLQLPGAGDKPALAERVIPFKAHLNFRGESWQTFWGYLFVLLFVTLGGVCSMTLSNWVPNRLSRAGLEEQLSNLASRTHDLSTSIDSGLRVFLRVERNRLHRFLQSWWSLSANFPDVVKQCSDKITALSKQIDLATQLDCARLDLAHITQANPIPTKIDRVDRDLQKAADLLRRSEPTPDDSDKAKSLIVGVIDQINKMDQTDPNFTTELSGRIESLKRYLDPAKAPETLSELKGLFPAPFTNFEALSADTQQYPLLDRVMAQLELIRQYQAYLDSTNSSLFVKQRKNCLEHQQDFLAHLQADTPAGLTSASLLLKQIKEGVFVDDIMEAIKAGAAEIIVEPLPIEDQLTKFTVQFKEDKMNAASAREEIRGQWDFGHKVLPEAGWEAYHYFPVPPASWRERLSALFHGSWPRKKPESFEYQVKSTFSKKVANTDPDLFIPKPIAVSKAPKNRSADRNVAEGVRLAVALFIAIVGLLAGAREQLAKLDLIPAAIAVFLLGFGADTIKNLITPKQTEK